MKYHIQTFGCQMNVYDTKSMMGLLNGAGHEFTENLEEAEMILLNTCSIREGAEQRVRGRIGQLKRYKDQGRLRFLGVCGCMGQKEGSQLTDAIPYLDLVMGPGAIGSITRLVDELERGNRPLVDITGIEDEYDQPFPAAEEAIAYPRFVSVMKGCNKKCTFCVVPSTRGPERSRDPRIILQEVETLVRKGYREITLIGQTINSYRFAGIRFPQLLAMVNQVPGLDRLRFTTSYPSTSIRGLFEVMASLDKVCEQLHLPVQSGSNRILQAMRRTYTREEYLGQVRYFRSLYQGRALQPGITTDIIVGFPGETEEDFQQTLDLVREARFDAAFMFKYSPRPGTAAAVMENQVDDYTKARRLDALLRLQHDIAREQNQNLVGSAVEVMIEQSAPSSIGKIEYEGRMRTGRIVKLSGPSGAYQPGDLAGVTLTGCSSYTLFGQPVLSAESMRGGWKSHVA